MAKSYFDLLMSNAGTSRTCRLWGVLPILIDLCQKLLLDVICGASQTMSDCKKKENLIEE